METVRKRFPDGDIHVAAEPWHGCLTHVECPRFSICLRGAARYRIARGGAVHEVALSRGDAIFASPGCMMDPLPESDYMALGVVFHAHLTRFLVARKHPAETAQLGHAFLVALHAPSRLDADGRSLCALIGNCPGRTPADPYLHDLFGALLARSLELLADDDDPEKRGKAFFTWQAACQFLQDHLSEPVGRKDVARFLRLHPNHVSRLFRQFSHKPFHEFVLQQRLARARKLLRGSSDLNVTDIAAASGFANLGYFSRCYQRAFGRAPSKDRMTGQATRTR